MNLNLIHNTRHATYCKSKLRTTSAKRIKPALEKQAMLNSVKREGILKRGTLHADKQAEITHQIVNPGFN